ncbi:MAG: hypothetical protein EBZ77_15075 [Chitinophagia bacterium]|nr:hypothetical protein [Chitinophagia bacterium]
MGLNTAERIYRLPEKAVPGLLSKAMAWRIAPALAIIVLTLALQHYWYHMAINNAASLITLGAVVLLLTIYFLSVARKLRQRLVAYELTLSADGIDCRNSSLNDLFIPFDSVSKVSRLYNGALVVYGNNLKEYVYIVPELEGFSEAVAIISSRIVVPITPVHRVKSLLPLAIPVGSLLLMAGYLMAKDYAISLGCGVALVAYLVWLMLKTRESNFNTSSRQASLIRLAVVLLVVVASLLWRIYRVLFLLHLFR